MTKTQIKQLIAERMAWLYARPVEEWAKWVWCNRN